MNSPLYLLAAVGFPTLTLICLSAVFYALRYALQRTDLSQQKQSRILYGTIFALISWSALVSILATLGIFSDFTSRPPTMMLFLPIPLITLVIINRTHTFKEILQQVPPHWIIAIQSFRLPVEIFLWALFMENLIPVQMSFEGRNFDVFVGISAPIFAYLYSRRNLSHTAAIVWNFFGLALLLNIIVISILSTPIPLRVFMNEPANTIVAQFPFVLLPMVLVPLAYFMHIFSLRQLLALRAEEKSVALKFKS
ncbi:MAG TPA: hypothetical protein VEC36_00580 [Patescibacteria group bacterium]|nr:hypothetical protein [Patescibacteria group bacterium]